MIIARRLMGFVPLLAALPSIAGAEGEAEHLAQIKAMFDPAAIVSEPELVDCTLSGGSETTCFSITVKSSLEQNEMGPWCPRNISDGPDASGIWPHEGTMYDADGAFVKNLSTFYDDPDWQLFDPATGKVNLTEGKEACELATRPDVDPTN
ncbi:hypothetical protein [Tabrizicola sp.]|uniref:hypothetical protein n=1 Tax=Tabrizicola sp. TaxID=2005166 RepID=UPI003F3726A3